MLRDAEFYVIIAWVIINSGIYQLDNSAMRHLINSFPTHGNLTSGYPGKLTTKKHTIQLDPSFIHPRHLSHSTLVQQAYV